MIQPTTPPAAGMPIQSAQIIRAVLSVEAEEAAFNGKKGHPSAPARIALIQQAQHDFDALLTTNDAMRLALDLLVSGEARIERIGTLVEFCFYGIRYILNGDWNALISAIGWDKCRAALEGRQG